MKKEISPKNDKGQAHGYWEQYWSNGQLFFKANYVNDKQHGYWEVYHESGTLWYKCYYDMGKRVDYEVLIETVTTSEMFPIY